MKNLFRDVRYSCRALWKSRTFSLVAVFTLALGIGANSTIFSWINATLLNPIPGISHTTGLVALTRAGAAYSDLAFSYLDYKDLREANRSLSGLAAFSMNPIDLTGTGKPE